MQGSLVRALGATETWIKPLSDGAFGVVLLNKGATPAECEVFLDDDGHAWGGGKDFFPATFGAMHVRDAFARKDLGVFKSAFKTMVGAHDSAILKMTPVVA